MKNWEDRFESYNETVAKIKAQCADELEELYEDGKIIGKRGVDNLTKKWRTK